MRALPELAPHQLYPPIVVILQVEFQAHFHSHELFTIQLDDPGVYDMLCLPHPFMTMKVIVD